jgi:8-oxo-dGTP pyrophosphatase MutT (NUDIX family)
MPPIFINRHNEKVHTTDGRTVYIARASSVVAEVCLYDAVNDNWHILLMQRGVAAPDFNGYWCLPCGYLDWDETLCQAMIREVYEESGLLLTELVQSPNFSYSSSKVISGEGSETPWLIYDEPETKRQNLAFHYATLFGWKGEPYPVLSRLDEAEVADVKWMPMQEAMTLQLAFGHENRINQLWQERAEWFEKVVELARL